MSLLDKLRSEYVGVPLVGVIAITTIALAETGAYYLEKKMEKKWAAANNYLKISNRDINNDGKPEMVIIYKKDKLSIPIFKIEKDKEGRWSAIQLN